MENKTYEVLVGYALTLTEEYLSLSGVNLDELNEQRASLGAPLLELNETYYDTAGLTDVPHEIAIENPDEIIKTFSNAVGISEEDVVLISVQEES